MKRDGTGEELPNKEADHLAVVPSDIDETNGEDDDANAGDAGMPGTGSKALAARSLSAHKAGSEAAVGGPSQDLPAAGMIPELLLARLSWHHQKLEFIPFPRENLDLRLCP